jgi:DNA-binding GntR family transcriptional regulator
LKGKQQWPRENTPTIRFGVRSLYGKLKPGERLVENRLSKVLKVARTLLREALSQLQKEGLRNRVYRYRLIAVMIPDAIGEFHRSHDEMLEALEKVEVKRASHVMRSHILRVPQKLVPFLKKFPMA